MENQKIVKMAPLAFFAKDYEVQNPYYRTGYASQTILTYKPAPGVVAEVDGVYIQRYGKDVYLAWRAK
jgi:hypothetical protein